MISPQGLRAVLLHSPWMDNYELVMGSTGPRTYIVTGIGEGGNLIYKEHEEMAQAEPFLRLSQGEVDAIVGALRRDARPVDATVDALRDSRETRDRLLALIEKRGLR